MRELRIGTFLVLSAALSAFGCDDGGDDMDGGADIDGNLVLMDSGPMPDTGPAPDTGTADTGTGMRMCGNAGECDVLQDNCAVGTTCRNLVMTGGTEPMGVCEMAGTKTEGMACSRDTMPECAEGLICHNGFCREYCCDGMTTDCSVVGNVCQNFVGTPVGICVPSAGCDLLMQTGCSATQGCYFGSGGTTQCLTPTSDMGMDGFSCTAVNQCAPGFGCVGPDASSLTCREFCDPAAADCPTDYSCTGLSSYPGLGVCTPPASGG